MEIESIKPFLQIIQIKISELQHAVRHTNPQRRLPWTECSLANKVALRFQDASNLADGLILVSEQLECAAARHGVERLRFERKRESASPDVINIPEALFICKVHCPFEHLD